MFTFLRSGFNSVIDLVFPARKQEKVVASLSDTDILSLPRSQGQNRAQNKNTYSLFSYKDPRVQALIWELKYHRNTKAIEIVGRLLAEYLIEEMSDKMLFENMKAVLLVPIPITATRLRERKFCQTNLICEEILRYVSGQMTYTPTALQKIRETEKQSWSKSREERLRNLLGAFRADEKLVRGKTIIVIDDVTTTGATLTEATRALKAAGARSVIAFTVAH